MTTKNTTDQKKELQNKLQKIEEQERKERQEKLLEENYQAFKNRPSVFMIGKGYCSPIKTSTGLQSLGISVTIPGNASKTYKITSEVPSAVITYFHNVFTNSIQLELQQKINKLVEETIEKVLDTPESVLEMLGLQSDDYFLQRSTHYPKDKIAEIEEEILQEKFKVIDKFTEKQLINVSNKLHHSKHLLKLYSEDRKLEKLKINLR